MIVPAYTGHLNPMTGLGRALRLRGHRVVIVSALAAEGKARQAGLEFIPVAATEFPPGEWERTTAQMGGLAGWEASRFTMRWIARFARGILRDLPDIARRERFDGLVMDHIAFGVESVCDLNGLPLAVACCALIGHTESRIPPSVFSWPYRPSISGRLRNIIGQSLLIPASLPLVVELGKFRRQHRLPQLAGNHGNLMPPSLVQVAQTPAFFDFPRRHLPDHFHYTGPWTSPAGESDADFPWPRLDGRPLIYASFGTLQNRLEDAYRIMAEACAGMNAQLVLALGRKGASIPAHLPGNPLVVDYAPQTALLRRASLVITHGGFNTALESLREGVPLVLLPVANDHPGVAARVARLGAGELIPIKKLTVAKLRAVVQRVLGSASYRERAQECAGKLRLVDGPAQAAELIERAFTTRQQAKRAR